MSLCSSSGVAAASAADSGRSSSNMEQLIQQVRGTLRRQSSPPERPLEMTLEDRLQSFHLCEGDAREEEVEAAAREDDDDFAGVRVLSPIADGLLAKRKQQQVRFSPHRTTVQVRTKGNYFMHLKMVE